MLHVIVGGFCLLVIVALAYFIAAVMWEKFVTQRPSKDELDADKFFEEVEEFRNDFE